MDSQIKKYQDIIIPIVKKIFTRSSYYLYGSRARKDHKDSSDIDIALNNSGSIDTLLMSKIIGGLEESTLSDSF